jgi:hypothetical protein
VTFDVNHWPETCPFGHELRPGTASTSWDMSIKKHWLLCGACNRRTGMILKADDQWQAHVHGRGWIPIE